MADETLLARAREYVGKPANDSVTARDAVNLPMIRRWCEAMGETNTIYTDEQAAKAAGHPGIVAPPAMLEVWTMTPYRPGGRTAEEGMAVLTLFDEAGYTGVVATNTSQVYDRYLKIGDIVTSTPMVSSVSDEKRTGLGIGHFVTLTYEFTDAEGKSVARTTFRILKFKPNLAQPKPKPSEDEGAKQFPHPRPAITHDNAFYWEGLNNRKLLFQSTADGSSNRIARVRYCRSQRPGNDPQFRDRPPAANAGLRLSAACRARRAGRRRSDYRKSD
jgi:hypothetical protein